MALKVLLKKAFDVDIGNLQVFGDSIFVVKWMQGTQQDFNPDLLGLVVHL